MDRRSLRCRVVEEEREGPAKDCHLQERVIKGTTGTPDEVDAQGLYCVGVQYPLNPVAASEETENFEGAGDLDRHF
jgi:hypothetical protein